MTRVVAGRWRGRRLRVPGRGTRPTADRVREAIFSRLDHELGSWQGVAVLDLYAGSGALGIEALSRGAARGVFVEADRAAAAVIQGNLAELSDPGDSDAPTAVLTQRAERLAGPPPGGPFDVVLADPPYDTAAPALQHVLAGLLSAGWLLPSAYLVVETSRRSDAPWPADVDPVTQRDYGETRVWYGRAQHPSTAGPDQGDAEED